MDSVSTILTTLDAAITAAGQRFFEATASAVGPIYSPAEIVTDPHIIARKSIITMDDAETGKPIRMASPAGRFSGFKGEVRTLGPKVGEHTQAVLEELLSYSPEQIEALMAAA